MERLQKILAEAGVASRRKSEELILDGRVKVNGKTITELGFKADFSDDIRVDDKPVKKEESVVFIFNKPKNVISSCKDEKGRVTILDYFDEPYRLYPLGRLDYDSSGLLLVTNDGELTQKILHPKYEVEKLYEVKIDKIVSDEKLNKLSEGIYLDGRKCAPCTIEILSKSESKKMGDNEWSKSNTVLKRQVAYARKMDKSDGFVVFDYADLHRKSAKKEFTNLTKELKKK